MILENAGDEGFGIQCNQEMRERKFRVHLISGVKLVFHVSKRSLMIKFSGVGHP